MQEIVLSGAHWATHDDFYEALLPRLGAPDWHGHNLDALWDSITGGDINSVNPPFRIQINGIDEVTSECKLLVDRVVALMSEAKSQGVIVEVICR
jgi:RNAse (barnase) inhibitor barstar